MEFRDDGSSKNGGVGGARRTKSSFDGTGLTSRFGSNCPPLPPGFRRPWNSQRRAEKAAEKKIFEI